MKHLKRALVANLVAAALIALGLLVSSPAGAATCFLVAASGSVTWSTVNTAIWASSSGGTGGTCAAAGLVPKNSADVATIDSLSGGGTVTLDSSMNGVTLTTLNVPTGTETINTNGQNLTLLNTISIAAAGANFTCGTSTFTSASAIGPWNLTAAATISCASATFVFNNLTTPGNAQTFAGGTSKSYGTLTVNAHTAGVQVSVSATTAITFANINLNGPARVTLPIGIFTVTGAIALNGTSSGLANFAGPTNTAVPATLTVTGATLSATWAAIQNISFTGGSFSSSNSTALFDMGGNTGVTGVAPVSGGGIIGGGL